MKELTSSGPTSDLVFACHHNAFSAYYYQDYSMGNVKEERGGSGKEESVQ